MGSLSVRVLVANHSNIPGNTIVSRLSFMALSFFLFPGIGGETICGCLCHCNIIYNSEYYGY
ncbi:MAG: hypothetical protein COB49_07225 [Alphaproteobacteria bacterium]|nr:MAG: hypothetical protein COB49_07225 [Alphaproteobacteria bacterium]